MDVIIVLKLINSSDLFGLINKSRFILLLSISSGVLLVSSATTIKSVTPLRPLILSMNDSTLAFSFFKARTGEQLVMTGLIVATDRNVNTTGTVIDIFEASSSDATAIDKSLFQFDLGRQAVHPFVVPNVLVTQGKFVNAKADDTNVLTTILGYFVPV